MTYKYGRIYEYIYDQPFPLKMTTSTANTTTTVLCPGCKRAVTLPVGAKAGVCPFCRAKVAGEVKDATK